MIGLPVAVARCLILRGNHVNDGVQADAQLDIKITEGRLLRPMHTTRHAAQVTRLSPRNLELLQSRLRRTPRLERTYGYMGPMFLAPPDPWGGGTS
jgi:hypothetical protein